MINTKLLIKFVIFFLILSKNVFSLQQSRPLSIDSRLHVIIYNPNDVFLFNGFYGYESSIVFEQGESVVTVTMGDSIAWQVVPNGNRIFLKPIENDATTNMTVITNKRVYHFELHAKQADSINDPDLTFSVKFLYPDGDNHNNSIQQFDDIQDIDSSIGDKSKLNFHYTISGPSSIAPIKIFDNGKHTFVEFKSKSQEIPSIFVVYSDDSEGLINYNISGKYIVIEQVAERFTLRRGKEVGCIFNEKMLAKRIK